MVAKITEIMIQYFGHDVRRINHALKVYSFAKCIAQNEKISETKLLIVEISAILHDIGIKNAEIKYHSSAGTYQEIEGPEVAKNLLDGFNLDQDILERILFIIGHHHTYQKIDDIDFQILVEADFLVNIFEDEIPAHSVNSIQKKYFKTPSGISLLEKMYL